ncbi:hypothetical protein [Phreatobacter sp.]|uniref:hypothetical protein n=1 Tax=Phreatobacter sp. TaxID=1966341 RepID=UPI0022CB586B|nr:hypothetical protein [Phreatobacter sp.]MCZ8315585.1 hypothetical protein [Phreatobacter sp.]
MNVEVYEILLRAMRMDRTEIFGSHDSQLPASEPNHAKIPQIGFVGRDFLPGGDVLLGINPGGGGDAYVRTPEDLRLLPIISTLRSETASPDLMETAFDQYAKNMQTWNLWRIAKPVLDACGRNQSEVAYLNWCPFRTRNDAMPHAPSMRRCREAYLAPLLNKLAPGRVIALGKKVGTHLQKEPLGGARRFVVPRTIGDSYLSADAIEVLEAIRNSGLSAR